MKCFHGLKVSILGKGSQKLQHVHCLCAFQIRRHRGRNPLSLLRFDEIKRLRQKSIKVSKIMTSQFLIIKVFSLHDDSLQDFYPGREKLGKGQTVHLQWREKKSFQNVTFNFLKSFFLDIFSLLPLLFLNREEKIFPLSSSVMTCVK